MSATGRTKPTLYLLGAIALIVVFVIGAAAKYLIDERIIDIDGYDVELTTLRWPTSDIAQLVPMPDATRGYVYWESGYGFDIDVGDYTREKFNDYIDACMRNGFNVDYRVNSNSYSAYNVDGFDLYVYYYEDYGVMNVYLDATKVDSPDIENDESINA